MPIQWDKQPKDQPLVLAANRTFQPKKIRPLGEAASEFLDSIQTTIEPEIFNQYKNQCRKMMEIIPPKSDLYKLTTADSLSIAKSKLHSPNELRKLRDILHRIVKENAGGGHLLAPVAKHHNGTSHVTQKMTSETGAVETVKLQPGDLTTFQDDFPDLVLGSITRGGRFAPLRTIIYDQIRTAGPSEYRVLRPTARMLENKVERAAFLGSMKKFFDDMKLPWLMKWSNGRNVFVIIRKTDLVKMKNGGIDK